MQEVLWINLVINVNLWLNSAEGPANSAPCQVSLLRQFLDQIVLDLRMDRGCQADRLHLMECKCVAGLQSFARHVRQLFAALDNILQRRHAQFRIQDL